MTDRRTRTDKLLGEVFKDVERVLGPQVSGRWAQKKPDLIDFPTDRLNHLLPRVTLQCLDSESARRVVDEFPNRGRGGATNTMEAEGDRVLIVYVDKRWPLDIASWAGEEGLASDPDAAMVIACL